MNERDILFTFKKKIRKPFIYDDRFILFHHNLIFKETLVTLVVSLFNLYHGRWI